MNKLLWRGMGAIICVCLTVLIFGCPEIKDCIQESITHTCYNETNKHFKTLMEGDIKTRLMVARNPDISECLMMKLITHHEDEIDKTLLDNPSVTDKILMEIAGTSKNTENLLKIIYVSQNNTPRLLTIGERRELHENAEVITQVLRYLPEDKYQTLISKHLTTLTPSAGGYIAESSKTQKDILEALIYSDRDEIIIPLSKNPNILSDECLINKFVNHHNRHAEAIGNILFTEQPRLTNRLYNEILNKQGVAVLPSIALRTIEDDRTQKDILEILIYSDDAETLKALFINERIHSDDCLLSKLLKRHHTLSQIIHAKDEFRGLYCEVDYYHSHLDVCGYETPDKTDKWGYPENEMWYGYFIKIDCEGVIYTEDYMDPEYWGEYPPKPLPTDCVDPWMKLLCSKYGMKHKDVILSKISVGEEYVNEALIQEGLINPPENA